MRSRALVIAAGVIGVAVPVIILASASPSQRAPASLFPLSPRRRRALELVNEVVPSSYPSDRFSRLAPGYRPDDPALPEGFTTCGYLPPYVGHGLGYQDGITRYGVEGARERGIALGAWVPWSPGKRPSPGDIFGKAKNHRKPGEKLLPSNILRHVGIVLENSAEPGGAEYLLTADAGQGGEVQGAARVMRHYDPKTGQTNGGDVIAGWINLDALKPPTVSKSMLDADPWTLVKEGYQRIADMDALAPVAHWREG